MCCKIIAVAGSSGSGKTSLAVQIVTSLNLQWVVILPIVNTCFVSLGDLSRTKFRRKDSVYKTLVAEQSKLAVCFFLARVGAIATEPSHYQFANEFDFDAPNSIDFDIFVEGLRDLKRGCVPAYAWNRSQLNCD